MKTALCFILGYFVGNINPAYILSRLKGFDIRERGTGNAGASNVTVIMGKKAGIFTAVFDILKAFFVAFSAGIMFPQIEYAVILTGVACIWGHIFPVVMKFRGGKGLACLSGVVLAFNPYVFLALLIPEVTFALVADYICVIAPSGIVIFTLVYLFMTSEPVGTVLLAVTSVIIILKHIGNFRRIRMKEETHISSLWKKQ